MLTIEKCDNRQHRWTSWDLMPDLEWDPDGSKRWERCCLLCGAGEKRDTDPIIEWLDSQMGK